MITHKRPHILYVEDDDDSCQMMTFLLNASGIDVTCKRGMADVLRFPAKDRFDLFLLDVRLNDGDGNNLCIKLRNEFPNIPVVFYTGYGAERERKQGILSGAAAYLVKPYSELIAPMILKLVNGAEPTAALNVPVDPLTILEENAKRLLNIMKVPGKPMPLSP
jgi:DNA-binding response OmpR family regulator